MLNIPVVQRHITVFVEEELSQRLHSRVSIGHIDLGLLNRIIIDNLCVHDQSDKEMLRVTRLSGAFEFSSLIDGRISISNIQLFGFDISLYKRRPQLPANYQFVIDALSSKDSTNTSSPIDLRINSLLIRRGRISYDVQSEPLTPGKFNTNHIYLRNIIASISVKAIRPDSINASIKRFSIEEVQSKFELKKLSLKVIGNDKGMQITHFGISLPHTQLAMDTLHMRYDSLGSLNRFNQEVSCRFRMLPSTITLSDLSAFSPVLQHFDEPIEIEAAAHGTIDQLNCPLLSISTPDKHFDLRGNVEFQDFTQPANAFVFGNLSRFHIDQNGIGFILRNISRHYDGIPPMLRQLGTIDFHGEVSGYLTDLVTYGQMRTALGNIQTDVKLSSDKEKGRFSYSGKIKTKDFELGKLFSDEQLGKVTLNVEIDSRHQHNRYPNILMKGIVNSLEYRQYTYENITLDGAYKDGGFDGHLSFEDPNVNLRIDGAINTATAIPTFDFSARLDHLRAHNLHLTPEHKDASMSLHINANFTGGNIDEMVGQIDIDSLSYTSPERNYFLDNFRIAAIKQPDDKKRLSFDSNFLRGYIEGDYSYVTLPTSVMNILSSYIPALVPPSDKEIKTHNNFHFDIDVYNTDLFHNILGIPLTTYAHSTIKGYFNEKAHRLRVEGYFPRLRYGNNFLESGMILCENSNQRMNSLLRFNKRNENGSINVAVQVSAKNDSIRTTLNWGNSGNVTYSGRIAGTTHFNRQESDQHEKTARKGSKTRSNNYKRQNKNRQGEKASLKTIISIDPTQIILNDSIWQVHASQIVVDSGRVHIDRFNFSQGNRHLRINGILSDQPTDTLRADLEKINIGYIFDMANLRVDFDGEATGPAWGCGILGNPAANADLFIRGLSLNDGLLGDTQIHGEWHNDTKGLYLDADISEKDNSGQDGMAREVGHSLVKGFIYPIKPQSSLDLQIKADRTNIKFIHHYMKDITPDFHGRATGDMHLYGKFNALTLNGKVDADASIYIDVLGTSFQLKDSIEVIPEGITFRNNRIYDTQGHQGTVNATVRYNHFKDIRYNFNFLLHDMLMFNQKESPDFPFYGKIFATGNARLQGSPAEGLNVHMGISTNRGSTFTFIKDNVSTATNTQFITFHDRTPRRIVQDSVSLMSDFERAHLAMRKEKKKEEGPDADIRLNLQLDVTPDAQMRIIMDPTAGDYISARGSGNIRADFYNKGDIKLFGNYNIDQGVYKFSLQEVIRKDFIINQGSSLTFTGAPEQANLDIRAIYTVNSASLNDLLPSTMTGSDYITQTKVKVNCIMDLTGHLTSPTVKLDLELPNERDEVQALVKNYLPTDEQINMQILYLLGIGKFYMPENADAQQNNSNKMMSSVLSNTLSGQLNNALSNIINSNNWNVGTNLSTGDRGWTDMEVEGILSGQLLNNRLIINGNFGYRDNPLANTNFVGDFEAEWLVNRSGDIRLKAYNETNDRYYTRTNLTTQGIGILFKKDFNVWRELFFWNKWKKKKKTTSSSPHRDHYDDP